MVGTQGVDLSELESRRIGGSFFSRKNTVFKSVSLGKIVIVKVYGAGQQSLAEKEFSILKECHSKKVSVPAPIELREGVVLMEFVEGATLADSLDGCWLDGAASVPEERRKLEWTAKAMGEWLSRFHEVFGKSVTRGDSNARNFLVCGEEIFGIDFEESSSADVLDDLGQVCSSILSMHPMFTEEKFEFCRSLSDAYFSVNGLDRSAELAGATAKALRYYSSYRSDAKAMLEMADELDRTGELQAGNIEGRSGHRST